MFLRLCVVQDCAVPWQLLLALLQWDKFYKYIVGTFPVDVEWSVHSRMNLHASLADVSGQYVWPAGRRGDGMGWGVKLVSSRGRTQIYLSRRELVLYTIVTWGGSPSAVGFLPHQNQVPKCLSSTMRQTTRSLRRIY